MAGLGTGSTATRELRWLITAQDATRVGMNSAIIAMEQLAMGAERVNYRMLIAGTAMVVSGGMIVKALGSCVDAAADFDVGLRNIQSISRDTTEGELQAMGDKILELSTKFPQSADTLVKSMYEIYSAGYEGADAFTILENAAAGASAGLTDTDTVIRMIIGILKAYGMQVSESTGMMDMLFNAVDIGIFRFEELAGSFGKVIGTAVQLNVPLQEILASYVIMTNKGQTLANAQIGLNRAFMAFLKPSDTMAKYIDKIGYSSGQAMMATEGLGGVLTRLRNDFRLMNIEVPESIKNTEDYNEVMAWLQTTTVNDAQALSALFPTVQGLRAILALTSGSAEEFNTVLNQISDTSGTTQAALEKQMMAYENQMKVFKNSIEVVKIKVGQYFLPILSDIINKFSAMVQHITDLNPKIGEFIAKAMGIGALTLIVGGLVTIFSAFSGGLGTLLGLFTAIPVAGWAVVAVGMAIATHFEECTNVVQTLKEVGIMVFDAIKAAVGIAIAAIRTFLDIIVDLLNWVNRIGALKPIIIGFIAAFVGLKVVAPIVLGVVRGIGTLINMATDLGLAAKTIFASVTNTAGGLFGFSKAAASAGTAAANSSGVMSTFGASLSSLATGGITLAVTGIAVLVGSIWAWKSAQNKAHEEALKIIKSLSEQGDKISTAVGDYNRLNEQLRITAEQGGDVSETQQQINEKLKELAGLCPTAIESFNALTGAYQVNVGVAQQVADALKLQGENAQEVNQAIDDGTSQLQAWMDVQNRAREALDIYTNSINEVDGVMKNYLGDASAAHQADIAFVKSNEDGTKVMNEFIRRLEARRDELVRNIKANSDGTMSEAAVRDAVNATTKEWDGQIGAMKNARDAINGLSTNYSVSASEIVATLNLASDNIKRIMGEMADAAVTAGWEIKAIPPDILAAFQSVSPGMRSAGVESLIAYFSGVAESFGVYSPTALNDIKGLILAMAMTDLSSESGRQNIEALYMKMLEGWGVGEREITTAVAALFPKVGDMAGEAADQAEPTGLAIDQGIARGIGNSDAVEQIKTNARAAVRAAIDAANEEAKNLSPSHVFADIGANLTLGMAVGMLRELSSVEEASRALVDASISDTRVGYRGYGVNYNPQGISAGSSNSNIDNRKTIHISKIELPGVTSGSNFISGLELEINRV